MYLVFLRTLACIDGYHGTNCSKKCQSNCKTCRHTDGMCTCRSDLIGPSCTTGINYITDKITKQWLNTINYLIDNI